MERDSRCRGCCSDFVGLAEKGFLGVSEFCVPLGWIQLLNFHFGGLIMQLMPDLMNALSSLEDEIKRGLVINLCDLNSKYKMIFDKPNGQNRFTYAKFIDGEVQVLANFVLAEPIDGVPCFNVGYAVKPGHRGKGPGIKAAKVGIKELSNGFARAQKGKSLYIEAVVESSNQHSIKVAERLFGGSGESIADAPSGKAALHFKKLIKL